ncbi:HD domain-containing protein [Desulforamulus hydrothermalis]|uniref:Metal dependent phosphohydrolase n=1 Tax=Desulforamulus hydrothermalis Lam5 = DSM 18033 TaxID=1121428 RepID=K8E0Q7_9FIRM
MVRHCRAVAEVAVKIARALDQAGYGLNIQLIQAAALLHDIARDKANHARAGAAYLREKGYPQVAGIVETHMDMPDPVMDNVTEAAVVFLADKLVQEDRPVSLEQRFQHIRNKYITNPDIAPCIEKRLYRARAIKSEVEKMISFPLERIIF